MLKIGNKVYRNLQEQVAKNQEDIATLNAAIEALRALIPTYTASNGVKLVNKDIQADTSVMATKTYAQTVASEAAGAVKLYTHYVRINFKLAVAPNVTYLATMYIISKDAEVYSLEDFKNINSLNVIKIPLATYNGDSLKTVIYDFAYSLNNKYGLIYSQLSNGALTNMDTLIDATDITQFRDIVLNL